MKGFYQMIGNMLIFSVVAGFMALTFWGLNHVFSEMGMCYK